MTVASSRKVVWTLTDVLTPSPTATDAMAATARDSTYVGSTASTIQRTDPANQKTVENNFICSHIRVLLSFSSATKSNVRLVFDIRQQTQCLLKKDLFVVLSNSINELVDSRPTSNGRPLGYSLYTCETSDNLII